MSDVSKVGSVDRKALARESRTNYIRGGMVQIRILAAAATLEMFTVDLLARLSGEAEDEVRALVEVLLERHRITIRKQDHRDLHEAAYTWTAGGEMAARAEVQASAPPAEMRGSASISIERAVEVYEDPFTSALDVARSWIEQAESSSDEQTLGRHLSMARAEVRALRRFLAGRSPENVEEIEELARRIELLSTRSPIEAFRSKVLKSIADAIRNAALHVPLGRSPGGAEGTAPDMAFVFNATRERSETAKEVEQTVGQIGAACVVVQVGGATAKARRLAFEALAPFFAGPGSAKTKVFIIIDSIGESRSRTVLRELVSHFGSIHHLVEERLVGADGATPWTAEPALFLSTITTPSNDWLPRGLLKHLILQNYIGHKPDGTAYDLARLTLNDPVVFDCGAEGSRRARRHTPSFSYHRVDIDPEHGAVIRGLVKGSFTGTLPNQHPYDQATDVRLLCSEG